MLFSFVALLLFLVAVIYTLFRAIQYNSADLRKRTLIVLGSGGHTTEMMIHMKNLSDPKDPIEFYPRLYVCSTGDRFSEEKAQRYEVDGTHVSYVTIPRARSVKQMMLTSIFTTIWATLYAFIVVFRFQPDLIMTNGPGVCFPVCLSGWIISKIGYWINRKPPTRIVYIESVARVTSLSATAKLLLLIGCVDVVIVQWPEIFNRLQSDSRIHYLGHLII
jgi:beta-1,4-N-acetylglucosaminyltransferase